MGLLSKLFGNDGKNAEKAAKELLGGLFQQQSQSSANSGADQPQNNQQAWRDPAPSAEIKTPAPSGDSWGEEMPAEENQFNFNGTYEQYFEGIFRSEFASYRIEKEVVARGHRRLIFRFFEGDRNALVVEIMPSVSESKKLRSDCRAQGIPYLRYYHDHEGWWNTRSYVVRRTSEALKG